MNFRAVFVPCGIFFTKNQVGCEFIPQLWWSQVREEMSHLPPLLHQRQGFLTWQADTAPGAGNFLPSQSSDTHAVFSVWCSENILFWLSEERMENTRLK